MNRVKELVSIRGVVFFLMKAVRVIRCDKAFGRGFDRDLQNEWYSGRRKPINKMDIDKVVINKKEGQISFAAKLFRFDSFIF